MGENSPSKVSVKVEFVKFLCQRYHYFSFKLINIISPLKKKKSISAPEELLVFLSVLINTTEHVFMIKLVVPHLNTAFPSGVLSNNFHLQSNYSNNCHIEKLLYQVCLVWNTLLVCVNYI